MDSIGGMPISSIPSSRELSADIEEADRSMLNGASLMCSHHDPSKLTADELFELEDFDDSGFA